MYYRSPQELEPHQVNMEAAFICCNCGYKIFDNRYNRPIHAPDNLCYDCWVEFFETSIIPYTANFWNWTKKDLMLWFISAGYSVKEISTILKVNSATLYRWRYQIRKNPSLLPEWVHDLSEGVRYDNIR
jgi:hypothetical protein